MTEPVRIDVVVTDHNLHEYVGDAVASALDQQGVSTRVIVVDDGSEVPLEATRFAWPKGLVKVIRHDKPRGSAAATNAGLRQCEAPFIAILDADDLWPTTRSTALLEPMLAARADIAYGCQVIFNDGDKPRLDAQAAGEATLEGCNPRPLGGACLIRSTAFERAGYLDETLRLGTFINWLTTGRHLDPPASELSVKCVALLRRSHERNITRTRTADYVDYLAAVRNHRST